MSTCDSVKSSRHFRPTVAEINLQHLQSNYQKLSSLLPSTAFFCPMVKANAYGHGAVEVARCLRSLGSDFLGVGLIEEAQQLRDSGDQKDLLLFGPFESDCADAVVEHKITPVLSSWVQIASLKKYIQGSLKVHIKFNTGMNRLGFAVDEAVRLQEFFAKNRQFQLEGICTHLWHGEDVGIKSRDSEKQMQRFEEALRPFKGLPLYVHSLNSSALLGLAHQMQQSSTSAQHILWPTGARPGLALYGLRPTSETAIEWNLQAVMSIKSRLATLHKLSVGERVSYNGTWTAARESVIGVVPMGYADGFSRVLSNKGHILCHGQRAPVIGVVCMDYFMVDLTEIFKRMGDIAVGEEVVIIGQQGKEQITADDWARLSGTISYEIVTGISERVPRLHIKEGDE